MDNVPGVWFLFGHSIHTDSLLTDQDHHVLTWLEWNLGDEQLYVCNVR